MKVFKRFVEMDYLRGGNRPQSSLGGMTANWHIADDGFASLIVRLDTET